MQSGACHRGSRSERACLCCAEGAPPTTTSAHTHCLSSTNLLEELGVTLAGGSAARCLVLEDRWAAELGAAVRTAGGRLVAGQRVDAETVAATLVALDDTSELRELDERRDAGILTEEEFAAKKANVLGI